MALITTAQRDQLTALFIAMFKAAPGADNLSSLVQAMEGGQNLTQIATELAKKTEFSSVYPGFLTASEFADRMIANLLTTDTPAAAKTWSKEWILGKLNAGESRASILATAVIALTEGPGTTNTNYASANATLLNKIEVSNYYSITKEQSDKDLVDLQNIIANVTKEASSVTAAKTSIDGIVVVNPGQTYTLTTSVDSITGGAGDDTINATNTGTSAVLGGLDAIDGGAGNDTLNITDTAVAANAAFNLPTGFSVKNVETLNIVANGSFGGGTAVDVSGMTGLTKFNGTSAGDGTTNHNVKAATTTDVALTVSANAATTTVNGGKTVSITGGGVATVNDAAGTNTGTTLTAVTLTGVNGNSTVKGGALTTLTVGGATTAARTYTVDNATADHTLTVNAAGTGYQADGTTEVQTIVVDTVATKAVVNTTAKSSLSLAGSTALKSVSLTGSGSLKLNPLPANVTSLDGSAASGALTLGDLNAALVTVKTGSGNDSLGIQATAATTVDTGAGNDTVTLKSALATGSTITLGAGNDKFLFGTGGSVATSTTTVVDAGDGTDSISANLITAGNAAQFKNFELVNLDSATGFDLALLTGSSITGLTMSNAAPASASYQNVTTAMGLSVDAAINNSAITSTLVFTGVSGTSDAYTISFAASAATTLAGSADVRAGTIVAAGIENFTIASGGTNRWNEIKLNAANARTLTITGGSNLDVDFVTAFGTTGATTGVSSIDGSAATGKLNIDLLNVKAAAAGLTVKGGSAADTISTSTFSSTLTGGAGADTFEVTDSVVATLTAAGIVITTITDATAGDKIVLADTTTDVFNTTKVNVDTATALIEGTVNALDLAVAGSTVDGQITWFQYGGNTYIVQEVTGAGAAIAADDIVVKLTGLIDLSTASYDAASNTLTLA